MSYIPYIIKEADPLAGFPITFNIPLQSELLEEVVTLVIYEDECREVLDVDLPDCLHSEFRVLHALDALDVVLSEDCCRTTD